MEQIHKRQKVHNKKINIPFIKGVLPNKPAITVQEVIPSLSHDNKMMKTFIDTLSTSLDNRLFTQEVFGYEIYATATRIRFGFVMSEEQEKLFTSKIRSTFKGSATRRLLPSSFGANDFGDNTKGIEVFDVRVRDASFLPLSMEKDAACISELVHALENLDNDESVWMQILIRNIADDWQEDFRSDYQSWLDGEIYTATKGVKGFMQKTMKKGLQGFETVVSNAIGEKKEYKQKRKAVDNVSKKLVQSGFDVVIRIAVKSHRTAQLIRGITAALRSISKENTFISNAVMRIPAALSEMKERKLSNRLNKMILCSSEVTSLFKLPDEKVECSKIHRMTPEEKQVDERMKQGGLFVGYSVNEEPEPLYYSLRHQDDIVRMKLYVASPGSGKSTQIEQLVEEVAKQGHGCAVFDIADGKLFERIIALLPEYKERLVIVDYTNEQFPPAFNFSALGGDDASRGLMFAEFFEVFFGTEDLARTQSYMMKAAMAVFSQDDSTLLEFIEMLRNEEFRRRMLPKIRKRLPDVYLWWMKEFPKITERKWNEVVAPILVRLDMFLYNHRLRNILCQTNGKLTPYDWMEQGKIVVFNMSNGTFTEPEIRILMSLHNYAFWNATLAREQLTKRNINPRPFHLFYDEPQTYMAATPMFSRAISKARKYRVGLNFFIQDAEQVIKQAPDLWKEILGMSPHMMIGPVSESTAKLVSKELGMTPDEILSIKKLNHCWIMKTYDMKQALPPVIVNTVDAKDNRMKVDTSHAPLLKETWMHKMNHMSKDALQMHITAIQMGMTVEEYKKAIEFEEEIEEVASEDGTFEWGEATKKK